MAHTTGTQGRIRLASPSSCHAPASEYPALGGAAVNFSEPLPVYTLNLDDIHGPSSTSKAQLAGWRYLLERIDGGGIAYADVLDTKGKQAFGGVAANKNAERLNQAAHLAEDVAKNLPDVEARILNVPSLNLSAIWLFGDQEKFIPFIDPEKFRDPEATVSVDPNLVDRLTTRADELRSHLSDMKQ
jgi:hypothetical protein